jgi:hypothetical protein
MLPARRPDHRRSLPGALDARTALQSAQADLKLKGSSRHRQGRAGQICIALRIRLAAGVLELANPLIASLQPGCGI